jgi:hypothetical protein
MTERLLISLALLALGVAIAGLIRLVPALWRTYLRRTANDPLTFSRNDGRRTLLYFYTQQCVSCKVQQEPALLQLAQTYTGRFSLARLDALEEAEMARRFHVLTVPSTVVLDENGRVVDANLGYASAERLAAQLGLAEAAVRV